MSHNTPGKTIHDKENISTPNQAKRIVIEDSPRSKPKPLEESTILNEGYRMKDITNSSHNRPPHSPSLVKSSESKKSLIKSLTLKLKDPKFFPEKGNSPISSQSSNDISYKILNEMLNSQSVERNQPLSKTQPRVQQESKRQLNFNKTSETAQDGYKTKYGFDINEHEDLKKVQDRINEVQKQIKNKSELLQSKRQQLSEDRDHEFYQR